MHSFLTVSTKLITIDLYLTHSCSRHLCQFISDFWICIALQSISCDTDWNDTW